jgi:thiamine pyrophosphate-dependent acetolactate synthase large subunit-like protein
MLNTVEEHSPVNNRQHRTGAQALVATLRTHHVDTIFGIPGVHTLPIYDAIRQESGLRHILARHEQGAGFMAEGYARIKGQVGLVCTITGPGVTNVSTAAANAYADSTPLLIISSTLPTTSRGKARGELHEIKHQLGVMESLVGWTRAINTVDEIPCAIYDAFLALNTGRPRGAYLQIPLDLLEQTTAVDIPDPAPIQYPQPDLEAIGKAVHLLRAAERPVIIAGAGVTASGANIHLQQLAELLQAPVILGSKSHDVLPTEHPLVLTTNDALPTELRTLTGSSDLVLVVGSKLGAERTDGGRLPLPTQCIHIDIDPTEINHNYPATVGIVSDARLALEALLEALRGTERNECSRSIEIAQVRAALLKNTQQANSESFALLEGLRAGLDNLSQEHIIVADMTLPGYACAQYLPVTQPRTFIHPAEFCTIGCGLPLALGAQVAALNKTVIAICGDGGFLLNASELATAVQEQLPVVAIIFNDSTYATVKKEQRRRFDGRYIATDLVAPDYVALAHAFHAQGIRAESPAELTQAVVRASKHDGPTIIEVPLTQAEW